MPTLNWIGKEAVVNHHQQVPCHAGAKPEFTSGLCGQVDSEIMKLKPD